MVLYNQMISSLINSQVHRFKSPLVLSLAITFSTTLLAGCGDGEGQATNSLFLDNSPAAEVDGLAVDEGENITKNNLILGDRATTDELLAFFTTDELSALFTTDELSALFNVEFPSGSVSVTVRESSRVAVIREPSPVAGLGLFVVSALGLSKHKKNNNHS